MQQRFLISPRCTCTTPYTLSSLFSLSLFPVPQACVMPTAQPIGIAPLKTSPYGSSLVLSLFLVFPLRILKRERIVRRARLCHLLRMQYARHFLDFFSRRSPSTLRNHSALFQEKDKNKERWKKEKDRQQRTSGIGICSFFPRPFFHSC